MCIAVGGDCVLVLVSLSGRLTSTADVRVFLQVTSLTVGQFDERYYLFVNILGVLKVFRFQTSHQQNVNSEIIDR